MNFILTVLITCVAWCAHSVANAAPRSLPAGLLDVTTIAGVYPNDATRDSTAGLQNAINSAFLANQTLYFPANTVYYVSNTLYGVQPPSSCADPERRSYRLWGGGRNGSRPAIVLKDSAAGFGSVSTPKRLIHIGKDSNGDGTIDTSGESCAFGHAFKNIDLKLGNSNPGAIALEMAVAQESVLEDVNIDATGAYAGITGVPGRSTSVGNIQITGGRYGFRLSGVGLSLYGIKLTGQTVAALYESAIRTATLVGFDIRPLSGVAVQPAGTARDAGHIGLYDGRIELATSGTAINNAARRIVDVKNVYFNNVSTLISNGSDGALAGGGPGWSRVNDYTYTPVAIGTATSWNLIDGLKNRDAHLDLTIGSPPPATDLISRHIWEGSPDVLDPNVIYVTDAPFNADSTGAEDATPALQAAIDSTEAGQVNAGKWIFIPPGTYLTRATVQLKAKTHMFGLPYGQSRFYADDAWTGGMSDKRWLIDTVDDADAETTLERVLMDWNDTWNTKGLWIGAIRWRVGQHSVLRGIRHLMVSFQCEDKPRQIFRVEGNGGGRWYSWLEGLQAAGNGGSGDCDIAQHMDKSFRKLYVAGTTQPLTIYGANPEHGGSASTSPANPFIEIAGGSNVRTFGMKVETNGPVLSVRDSTNIFIGSSVAFDFGIGTDPYVLVENSDNIAMSMIAAWGGSTYELLTEFRMPSYMLPMSPSDIVYHDAEIGRYSRGSLNWSAWPTSDGPKYDVTVVQGAHGTISPATVTLEQWTDQIFTITPDSGYRIADVSVDNASVGPVSTYSFSSIQADHTLTATFAALTAAPSVSLTASPTSITDGDAATLNWSATDASSCQASGAWSGTQALSGSLTVTPTTTSDYVLSCTGAGGTGTATVTITVTPRTYTIAASAGANGAIAPSGNVSVVKGATQSFTLTPNSGYRVASVVVDGASVPFTVSNGIGQYTFTNVTDNHTIAGTFAQIAIPSVSLTAFPSRIRRGSTSLLTWASANATSCTASGGWSGSKPLSGSQQVAPSRTTTYMLTCSGPGGSRTTSVQITVR